MNTLLLGCAEPARSVVFTGAGCTDVAFTGKCHVEHGPSSYRYYGAGN